MGESVKVDAEAHTSNDTALRKCGIVRPIAAMGDYSRKHWEDVHSILSSAALDSGFELALVSETDISGTILGDIVTNLYFNEVVICDVSGRNPNVMFELGMRLAFEKPVVIVVDDETPFSFDISPIKHLVYPRSLRYADVLEFKKKVSLSLKSATEGGKVRGYLQQFGPIEVTELNSNKVDVAEIAAQVSDLTKAIASLRANLSVPASAKAGGLMRSNGSKKLRNLSDLVKGIIISVDKSAAETVKDFLHSVPETSSIRYLSSPSKDRNYIAFSMVDPTEFDVGALLNEIRLYDQSAKFDDPIFA